MTSFLIDINVWLALSWNIHPYSNAAYRWLSQRRGTKPGCCFAESRNWACCAC